MTIQAVAMINTFTNPLKQFKERIKSLSDSFPEYLNKKLQSSDIFLNEKTIELGKKEFWIDWRQYPSHHSFYFDFDDCEATVGGWFRNSRLREYPFVIMDFGYQNPVSEIPTDIFFDYWYELVIIAGYESVVLTEDGKLFMEFVRRDYTLKSNFEIKP